MSRGFEGFEIDDFQRRPERDVNRSPGPGTQSGWNAVRRLERIRGESGSRKRHGLDSKL